MITYFEMRPPDSESLLADAGKQASGLKAQFEIAKCPITKEHVDSRKRISQLFLQVKHNYRDEMLIWPWIPNRYVVHEKLLLEFEREGFTGYRTKPAAVCFRDGSISSEYHEFIVVGWAGMASAESGIKLIKSCSGCHTNKYSSSNNVEAIIDWKQWTGDDFFLVWPIPLSTLITERVAKWLLQNKIKSFALGGLQDVTPAVAKFGFSPGRLSDYFPEDLAIKYGRPLGLE